MLKFLFLGLAAVIVIFLIVAAMQPADFRISRSATLAAPAPVVFEQINDFHKWNEWSPWAKMDPNSKGTYDGPPSGVGASFAWSGNSQVGEGKMTITESKPSEFIRMRLEFLKPFAATNVAEFTLQPEGDQTAVTWSMSGRNGFVGKCMGLIMNCDKMVGGQFEQGFANLKAIVETPAKS
jgi:hypothetical protein